MRIKRREWGLTPLRRAWVLLPLLAALCCNAYGGAQQYEPLSDSVRTALRNAAAPDRTPPEPRFATALEKANWLSAMSERLPMRHKPDYRSRVEFLKTVHYEATRAGLDPQLILGLITVESGFRRHAISSAGARGYMQVMPFWAKLIGNGDTSGLFEMRTNIRMGCVILRHYLDIEKGDLFLALGRYNGSRGKREYPDAVTAAWKNRWAWQPPAAATSPAPAR
ncbi:MAG: lytic transglycosylase domain-containing protein [Burkholderiales bacterium]|nr:lytic transglycosylase domain-containing protein [Burkholderiales bacterium]